MRAKIGADGKRRQSICRWITADAVGASVRGGSAAVDVVFDVVSTQGLDPDHPVLRDDVGLGGILHVSELRLLRVAGGGASRGQHRIG